MAKRSQHIVCALLVFSYVFVGAAAHLDTFSQLLALGSGPQKVSRTIPTPPAPAKLYWTQHKHIPTVTKTAPAPPAAVSSLEFPPLEQYEFIIIPFNTLICPQADVSTVSSRAPPVIS